MSCTVSEMDVYFQLKSHPRPISTVWRCEQSLRLRYILLCSKSTYTFVLLILFAKVIAVVVKFPSHYGMVGLKMSTLGLQIGKN